MKAIIARCLLLALLLNGASIANAHPEASRYQVLSIPADTAEQKINSLAAEGWQVRSTAAGQCPSSAASGQSQRLECLIITFEKVSSSEKPDDGRTTYILDQDLVRFGKFAAAVLAVFLVVGAYLFGFKLESALEKVRTTQQDLKAMQEGLSGAQRELESAQLTVRTLKNDVERVLAQANAYVVEISDQKTEATAILASIKELSPQQNAKLEEVKSQQPEKFRPDGLGKLWPAGTTLRIRFLDGSAKQRDEVRRIAVEWTKYANLRFEFVTTGEAEIRISFKPDDGAWSYVGTDALSISKSEPTMNLGWIEKETVLQQFGHALGLIKEHQNPKANIPWNKKVVYKAMTGAPNFWSKQTVDANIFAKYPAENLPGGYRDFDPHSIMAYYFPEEWTGGVSMGGIKALSKSDKELIAKLYPHDR